MNKKEIAVSFLKLASSGQVRDAYEKHIHPQFRHHNAYFKGDRESLRKGMEENAIQFPHKTFEVLRVLEDGHLVAVHGKVKLSPESQWSVIHIFRFEENMIVELWEASQEVLKDSPNENGIF
ncbi:MAG: nuclear transport factor 2 family protein [Ignavibacteriae bacterium]|nr:MAG: nuclear transport factor 2 family protein [Ignavibacteriota bacterium]